MVQTSAETLARSTRRRRLAPELRSRLEADVAEIRTELSRLATKDDLEDVKAEIHSAKAEILEAIECHRVEKSPSA